MKKMRGTHRQRRLSIEHLERRDLLADFYSGGMHFWTTGLLHTSEQGDVGVVLAELVRQPVPGCTVTLTMWSTNAAEGLADGLAANLQSLSWTDADWNMMKTFRMVGQNDTPAVDDGAITYMMWFERDHNHTAGIVDPFYTAIPPAAQRLRRRLSYSTRTTTCWPSPTRTIQ